MKNVGLVRLVPVHTRTFRTYTRRRDRCRHPFPLLPSQHAHRPQAPLLMVPFRQCLQVSALRPYSTQTRIQIMCRHRGCKTTHNTHKTHKLSSTQPHERTNERTNGQIDRQTDRQIQTNKQTHTRVTQDKTREDRTRRDKTRRDRTSAYTVRTDIYGHLSVINY